MADNIYWVVTTQDNEFPWAYLRENAQRVTEYAKTQNEAVVLATRRLRGQGGGRIAIKRPGGEIREWIDVD